jgi:type I restriction enzyme S subunit
MKVAENNAQSLPKGYKQTEVGLIPSDWEVKELGEIGDVKMCRRVFNHETTLNGIIPFYKIGTFGKEADSYISQDLYNEYRQRFSFPTKGDILISAAGTIGRTIIYNGEDAYFQDSNIVWIDNKQTIISNDFLYHTLQIVKYQTEGGTIQRLYNSILRATKFLCPTKTEQSAIATALSDADALISSLEKLLTKKRNIKQGAMQKLLQPKEGWEVKRLGDSADICRGGSPRPIESFLTIQPDGINWIKIGDVKKNAKYIESTDEKIISEGLSRSRFVNEGDFLLSNSMSFGRPYIMKISGCIHDGWLVIQNYQNNFDRDFLYYVLGSEAILQQYKAMASGSSVLNLNKEIVKNVIINCPKSVEEQSRIATILSDLDNEISALETKLEKYKKVKLGMMQNLLTGKIRLV